MRRLLPLGAEVLGGQNDPAPEELLPYTVDRHPCGQRIIRAHDPLRQPQSRRERIGWRLVQKRREPRFDQTPESA